MTKNYEILDSPENSGIWEELIRNSLFQKAQIRKRWKSNSLSITVGYRLRTFSIFRIVAQPFIGRQQNKPPPLEALHCLLTYKSFHFLDIVQNRLKSFLQIDYTIIAVLIL